jgi:hypothetical protein
MPAAYFANRYSVVDTAQIVAVLTQAKLGMPVTDPDPSARHLCADVSLL